MKNELIKIGLNDNEAEIYLAGLGMRAFTAAAMAQHTKIKRSTTYLALSNLIKLGLVSETFKNKKKLFRVEGPETLKKLTQRLRRKAIEAESIVEQIIPILKNTPGIKAEAPHLAFYEGIEGIKNVLLDISASKRSWYFFGSSTEMIKKLDQRDIKEILEEGTKFRREANSPKIYFITDDGMIKLKDFSQPELHLREVKILSETIKASSALIISEDQLVILNFSHPFAAVIKSLEVVEVVKVMYKLIWDGLKQPSR
jgi:sugar-specific transcriptional regulator TrmB